MPAHDGRTPPNAYNYNSYYAPNPYQQQYAGAGSAGYYNQNPYYNPYQYHRHPNQGAYQQHQYRQPSLPLGPQPSDGTAPAPSHGSVPLDQ